jgi:hypothetical protein
MLARDMFPEVRSGVKVRAVLDFITAQPYCRRVTSCASCPPRSPTDASLPTEDRRATRIFVRMPVMLLVKFEGRKAGHYSITVDISQRGARVRANFPLWPGQIVDMLPGKSPGSVLPSRVVWVNAGSSGQEDEAGLEFLHPLAVPD